MPIEQTSRHDSASATEGVLIDPTPHFSWYVQEGHGLYGIHDWLCRRDCGVEGRGVAQVWKFLSSRLREGS